MVCGASIFYGSCRIPKYNPRSFILHGYLVGVEVEEYVVDESVRILLSDFSGKRYLRVLILKTLCELVLVSFIALS